MTYDWRLQESAGATLTVGEIQLEGGCEVVDPEVSTPSESLRASLTSRWPRNRVLTPTSTTPLCLACIPIVLRPSLPKNCGLVGKCWGEMWLCVVQDPTCAKVSISGRMAEVPEGDINKARELLFSRHPQMEGWPKGHNFRIYELQTDAIRLLDFYGGAADVSSKDYLAAQLKPETS